MKYACNNWGFTSFPSWVPVYSIEETILRIAAAGYSAMEIGCAAPHAWPDYLSAPRRREIRRIAEGEGVSIVSLLPAPGGGPGCNPCSILEEERAFTLRHYRDVIDLAETLGASLVLYIAGWRAVGMSREEGFDLSRSALGAIADYAAERGIRIAIEPTSADSNLIDSAADAVELMRATGRPNVKLMFDTCHLIYRGETASSYVREMGADLVHIHAADRGRVAPGDGDFDWHDMMAALKAANFAGYITMEAGFGSRDADPDEAARRGLRYLKAVEAELG